MSAKRKYETIPSLSIMYIAFHLMYFVYVFKRINFQIIPISSSFWPYFLIKSHGFPTSSSTGYVFP